MRAIDRSDYLAHFGIKGMKWGVRRFQNKDGSYTAAGLKRRGGGGAGGSRRSASGRARSGSGTNAEARKARMKKALMIGAGLAGTAALAYGIKSGKLKGAVGALKNTGAGQAIGRGMTKLGNTKAGLAARRGAANARIGIGNAKNAALSKYYAAKYDFNNSKAGQRLDITRKVAAQRLKATGGKIAGSRVGQAVGGAGRRVAGGARTGASAVRRAGGTIASKARGSRAGQAVGSFKKSAGNKINSLAARGEQVLKERKIASNRKKFAQSGAKIAKERARQDRFHNLVKRGESAVNNIKSQRAFNSGVRDVARSARREKIRNNKYVNKAINKGMYVAGNIQRVPGNVAGATRAARRSIAARGITRDKLRNTLTGNNSSRLNSIKSVGRSVAKNKVARAAGLGAASLGAGYAGMAGLTAAQKRVWAKQGYTQYSSKSNKGKKKRR